ncbi:hypothetical protein KY290_031702 [Solanum tuberosum]|uniref:CCHC-type domain-containing protein n=1 Tax=Solanum tuberosum TaxID=4113 RepID=A0ABQ7U9Z6_SOLTU|nr:hypothetical protein KY289_031100 [Solanum tuberosum]KAH0743709.1 hypothetical protein KY290_031702 [Solanum tuberosum]
MDIDYAIRKDEPPSNEIYTQDEIVLHEQWERSNRLSVMFIKTKISTSIRGFVEQYNNVKTLLKAIDEQFETSDEALANTLIMKFSSMKLTSVRGVCEHIMKMRDLAAQIKILEYGPFKISYNTHKDKWFTNELMAMCVQHEGQLLMETGESAFTTTQGKKTNHANKRSKEKAPLETDIKKESKCHFCRKKGHITYDCVKFQQWLVKKGIFISLVSYEANMIDVNHNTWWIDSASTIHIMNSL